MSLVDVYDAGADEYSNGINNLIVIIYRFAHARQLVALFIEVSVNTEALAQVELVR